MPLNSTSIAGARQLAKDLKSALKGMKQDDPDYAATTADLQRLEREIISFDGGPVRKVDANGKLKEDVKSHLPVRSDPIQVAEPYSSSFVPQYAGGTAKSESPYPNDPIQLASPKPPPVADRPPGANYPENYFFEPNVAEAREAYKRNPRRFQAVPGLEAMGNQRMPQRVVGVPDPLSGFEVGTGADALQWVVPPVSNIDAMKSGDVEHNLIADELWKDRMEEARQRGQTVSRYRDVKLDDPAAFYTGGMEYNIDRRLAPAAFAVGNAYSAGQAQPLYDTMLDLTQHEFDVRNPETPLNLSVDIRDLPPKSEDVILRSPVSNMLGSVLAYANPTAPANFLTNMLLSRAGYAGANMLERAALSGLIGGSVNALEGYTGDLGRELSQVKSSEVTPGNIAADLGTAALNAAENIPLNLVVGGVPSAGLDVAGNVAGNFRQSFRQSPGVDKPLQTFEEAGGRISPLSLRGVTPPPEVPQFNKRAVEIGQRRSAAELAAEEVAPHLEAQLAGEVPKTKEQIKLENEEYFNHPAYNWQRESGTPAINALLDMAQRGWGSGPISGRPMNVNRPRIQQLGEIIDEFSEARALPDRQQANQYAAQIGGTVLDGDIANELLPQFKGQNALPPGTSVVIAGIPLDARLLTELEDRIDEELRMAATKGKGADDPTWNRLNDEVKAIRDRFPMWRDQAGNLVPPPGWQGPGAQGPGGPGAGGPGAGGGQPGGDAGGLAGGQPGGGQPGGPGAVAQGQFVDSEPITPPTETDPFLEGQPALPEGGGGAQTGTQADFEAALREQRARERGRYRRLPPSEPGAQLDLTEEQIRALGGTRSEAPHPPSVEPEPITPLSMLAGNRLTITDEGITASRAPQLTSWGQGPQGQYENMLREQQARELVRNPRLPGPSGQPLDLTQEQYDALIAEQGRRGGPQLEGPPSPPVDQAADTPRSLLAGNRLAITDQGIHQQPVVTHVRGGDTEPLVRPPQRPDETSLPPEVQEAIDRGALPDEAQQRLNSQAQFDAQVAEARAAAQRDRAKADERIRARQTRGPLERLLDKGLEGEPGVNVEPVTPSAAREVQQQGEQWFEDIVAPGAPARSAEAKRMLDLTNQREAFEQITASVDNMDRRLGPIPPEDKLTMVLQEMSKKLGREVTKEDLVRAGFITGGAAALYAMDDDQRDVLGAPLLLGMAAARGGGGGGRRGKGSLQPPSNAPQNAPGVPQAHPQSMLGQQQAAANIAQPRFTLPNGQVVEGFSAFRQEQHQAASGISDAERRLGVNNEKTLRDRIISFGQGVNGGIIDEELMKEAVKAGKQKELLAAAATKIYPQLEAKAKATKGDNWRKAILEFIGMRGDKAAEFLSGSYHPRDRVDPATGKPYPPYSRNPFERPETQNLLQELLSGPVRQLTNLTGGAPGARFGNDWVKVWDALFPGELRYGKDEQKNEERNNVRR